MDEEESHFLPSTRLLVNDHHLVCRAAEDSHRDVSAVSTARSEVLIFRSRLYSRTPNLRNLFMNTFTRARVVPTISAKTDCDTWGRTRHTWSCPSPWRASSRSVRASRFSA